MSPKDDDGTPFRTFKLVFTGESAVGVFRGGEILTGRLEISLKRPMVLHAIKLQVKGRACWLHGEKQGAVEKVYFDRDIVLLERPPGRAPGDFPWAADYLYSLPFECPIPLGCPTSYESPKAYVRYFCRCVVEEAKGDGNKATTRAYSYKRPFTMLAAPPSRVDPGLLRPVGTTETVSTGGMCCCCCKGKLTAEFNINKAMFAPGETVYGALKINSKKEGIEGIECRLVDRATRTDAGGAKTDSRVLVSSRLDQLSLKGGAHLERENVAVLQIPSVAPSALLPNPISEGFINEMYRIDANNGAEMTRSPSSFYEGKFTETMRKRAGPPLFRVEYELQLVCGPRLLLTVPITVGSVPLSKEPDQPPATGMRPFALGPQDIAEEADGDLVQLNSLEFAPMYPVRDSNILSAANGR